MHITHRVKPALSSARGSSTEPSAEFMDRASHRLGIVAAVVAAITTLGLILDLVLHEGLGLAPAAGAPVAMQRVGNATMVLLSLGVFAASRKLSPPRVLFPIGFAYQVVGALLIAIPAFWGERSLAGPAGTLTWVAVWIVLFPLLVPARPRTNVAAALLSASAPALVFLAWCLWSGTSLPPTKSLADTFVPYYFCAALAVAPAWLIYGLGASLALAERRVRELGSYQLVESLGAGGMGEVWRAKHRLLARPAAIKLIRPSSLQNGSDAGQVLARFQREAEATASLESPHTIQLYDYGATAEGTLYYVMELLRGIDLEHLVERFGALPPERVVHILKQACDSLSEAHSRGLIHRDVKPANLFLCRHHREHDFVKVLDFGLVAKSEPEGPDATKVTGEGLIVGTPAYMAPEQARGGSLTALSDVYSLGCVAYWLLTGRIVFDHKTALDIMVAHARTAPAPPSRFSPGPLPPGLEALVLQCLEKDPARRPRDAQALARALDQVVLAPWSPAQAARWWEAHLDEEGRPLQPDLHSEASRCTTLTSPPQIAVGHA